METEGQHYYAVFQISGMLAEVLSSIFVIRIVIKWTDEPLKS